MGDPSGPKNRSSRYVALLLCIALLALTLRLVHLDTRPMHGDEANQAYKAGTLLETGQYIYDPEDHHGPTLYYLALISAVASGKDNFAETTESTYRIVPVLFGAALILLLIPLRMGLGTTAAVCSAILIGISPAFVFYSRYFIQEMLLIFFTFAAIVSGWRYFQRPSLPWALATGLSLGLMHATKETAIIAYASIACALAILLLTEHGPQCAWQKTREHLKASHAIAGIAIALATSFVLYTAFFSHARGPLDSILTYGNYVRRAGGAGIHDKPWDYYLRLLSYTRRGPGPWWSEAFILTLACAGTAAAFTKRANAIGDPKLIRFIALYTLMMTAAYSIIPYKTPWSMLSFFHGMILLAGIGAAACLSAAPRVWLKAVVLLVFAAGCTHLTAQTLRSEFKYPADPVNPYVYAHTSTAMLDMAQRTEDLALLHEDGANMLIRIIQPDADYWPIPWYLRRFPRAGYWNAIPESPDAPMIIADPSIGADLLAQLRDEYIVETRSLRPGVLRSVYIEKELWDSFIETRR